MAKLTTAGFVLFALAACGGGEKTVDQPEPAVDETEEADPVTVSPETYDEINRMFNRKSAQISRCFIAGVEAGEIDKDKTGQVTVQLLIKTNSRATNIELPKNSFQSAALKSCIVEAIAEWEFPAVPKDLEYSHAYKLGSL